MTNENDTPEAQAMEVAPREMGWLAPSEVVSGYIRQLIEYKGIMVDGEDYGIIPGTDKPTLFQPGADTLCRAAGLSVGKTVDLSVVEDWDGGLFAYRVHVPLHRPDGSIVAWGVGSCNSKEERYAYRWVIEFKLSETDKGRAQSENWRTERRKAKSGKEYEWIRVPNEEPASLANTLYKMAVKRAYVSAALRATGAHRIFSQDIGDDDKPIAADVIEGEVVPASDTPAQRRRTPARATEAERAEASMRTEGARDTLPKADNGAGKARNELKRALDDKFKGDEQAIFSFVELEYRDAADGTQVHYENIPPEDCKRMMGVLKAEATA